MAERVGETVDVADLGRRHARWSRRTSGIVAATCLVAALLALPVYRGIYDEWPWTTYPATLHVCGRDFQPSSSGETSRARIVAQGYHLVRRGNAPGIFNTSPLWTFDTVHGQATDGLPGGCHVVMWVQGDGDTYRDYELEGGP